MWRQDHPQAELQPVPADMVIASGCGLDPHTTLDNALHQLDRVAAKWAEKSNRNKADIRRDIESLLQQTVELPLGGLTGVKLVNVLEMNWHCRFGLPDRQGRPSIQRRSSGKGNPASPESRPDGRRA
jgi:K+-transporting ATPase c subunit